MVRKWDMITSRDVMQIKVDSFGAAGGTVVWALAALSDGTVVSGDANGHVHFWDSRTGTLVKTFREHRSDVLALAVSPNEDAVFASGMDSRIAMMRRRSGNDEWVYTYSHRPHTHDVRALATLPCVMRTDAGKRELAPLIVSGGLDTKLISLPVEGFALSRPYKVAPFPQRGRVSVAKISENRLLLLVQQQRCLQLWSVADGAHSHLAQIQISSHRIIRCASMSRDGRWIACADAGGLKVMSVNENLNCAPSALLTRHEVQLHEDALAGGLPTALTFVGSSALAVATQSGDVFVSELGAGSKVAAPSVLRGSADQSWFYDAVATAETCLRRRSRRDRRIQPFDVR